MATTETADIEDLRAFGRELAESEQSPWEPLCIARVFSTPREGEIALTLQGWIELEAVRSPLLTGGLPEGGAQLDAALAVFGLSGAELDGQELALVATAMVRAVSNAFAAGLKMRDPHAQEGGAGGGEGFGQWLPLLAFLVRECHMGEAAALAMRVDRALMLLAATRFNQGWSVAGEPYAMREAGNG